MARPFCEELYVADIETTSLISLLGPAQFDVIVFADVLEHLRQPAVALANIKPLIAEAGYVVASVPNVTHASIIFEMLHGRFEYRGSGLLDDTHLRFFSKQGTLRTFEDAGYVVSELERVRIEPLYTEFQTQCSTTEGQRVFEYMLAHNPEALTYQFVIRAVAATSNANRLNLQAQFLHDQIAALEQALETHRDEVRKLRSERDWLAAREPFRALRHLRKAIKSLTTRGSNVK
jgi:hypothetical protein